MRGGELLHFSSLCKSFLTISQAKKCFKSKGAQLRVECLCHLLLLEATARMKRKTDNFKTLSVTLKQPNLLLRVFPFPLRQ